MRQSGTELPCRSKAPVLGSAVHGLEEVSVSDFLMLLFQENLSRLFSLAGRCVCFPLRGTFRLTVGF